jgi:hypothetical protein
MSNNQNVACFGANGELVATRDIKRGEVLFLSGNVEWAAAYEAAWDMAEELRRLHFPCPVPTTQAVVIRLAGQEMTVSKVDRVQPQPPKETYIGLDGSVR